MSFSHIYKVHQSPSWLVGCEGLRILFCINHLPAKRQKFFSPIKCASIDVYRMQFSRLFSGKFVFTKRGINSAFSECSEDHFLVKKHQEETDWAGSTQPLRSVGPLREKKNVQMSGTWVQILYSDTFGCSRPSQGFSQHLDYETPFMASWGRSQDTTFIAGWCFAVACQVDPSC